MSTLKVDSLTTTNGTFNIDVVDIGYNNAFMQVEYQLASGTAPLALTTSFTQTPLNTVVTNDISGASLSSNNIILPAGTYYIEAEQVCGASSVGAKMRLRTSSVIMPSMSSGTRGYPITAGQLTTAGVITLASSTSIYSEMIGSSAHANGRGYPSNLGDVEVYLRVKIWKKG